VWKMQYVTMALTGREYRGYVSSAGFPYVPQQRHGSYIGIALFVLWSGRRYYAQFIRRAVLGQQGEGDDEQMSYAPPVFIVAVGLVVLVVFRTNLLGATLPATLLFWGGYVLVALSITRLRAEFGVPAHNLLYRPLIDIMVPIGGARTVGRRNIVSLSLLWWLVRGSTGHPMPHVLEGLTLGQRRGASLRAMVGALSAAGVVALVSSYWSILHHGYSYGFIGRPTGAYYMGQPNFSYPAIQFRSMSPPHWERMLGLVGGTCLMVILLSLRQRYLSWPLHPPAYAISSCWEGGVLWLPMMVAGMVKLLVVRYGGHKLYGRLIPFFLGLVLGEFVVGPIWGIVGTLGGFSVYRFWP